LAQSAKTEHHCLSKLIIRSKEFLGHHAREISPP
jgi:hypothetical protein